MKIPNWLRKLLSILKLAHDAGLIDERGGPGMPTGSPLDRPADLRRRPR